MLFDAVASDYRNRGHTRERAFIYAAGALGVTVRRFKAVLWGEPVAVHDAELAALRRQFLAHCDDEADDLARRSAEARARRRQMELEI